MGEKVVFQNGTAILGFLLDAFPVDQVLCILSGIPQQQWVILHRILVFLNARDGLDLMGLGDVRTVLDGF